MMTTMTTYMCSVFAQLAVVRVVAHLRHPFAAAWVGVLGVEETRLSYVILERVDVVGAEVQTDAAGEDKTNGDVLRWCLCGVVVWWCSGVKKCRLTSHHLTIQSAPRRPSS